MGRRAEDRLSALAAVADALRCPVCGASLVLGTGSPSVLGCDAGHRFDVARQGHVVLVPGGSRLRADTTGMVAARVRVMASGAFDAVRAAVVRAAVVRAAVVRAAVVRAAVVRAAVGATGDGLVVDLGAGPGTYTAAVLDALPSHRGLALELSVPALRVAARAHGRLGAVGADLTRPLPLRDAAVGDGLVMAVFAPLPPVEELARVTPAGSRLVVVTPTPDHLAGLRGRLGLLDVPAGKPDRLDERLAGHWQPTGRDEVASVVHLNRELAADVVAMGPNAWHTDDRLRTALAALPDAVTDTVAVTVSTYHRR